MVYTICVYCRRDMERTDDETSICKECYDLLKLVKREVFENR